MWNGGCCVLMLRRPPGAPPRIPEANHPQSCSALMNDDWRRQHSGRQSSDRVQNKCLTRGQAKAELASVSAWELLLLLPRPAWMDSRSGLQTCSVRPPRCPQHSTRFDACYKTPQPAKAMHNNLKQVKERQKRS